METNISLLITGGNRKTRQEKTEELTSTSSKFDRYVIDALESRGIEVVREIISNLAHKPFQSAFTSVVILNADNLTPEAQNALLKILEEPPAHAQLILESQNKKSLLDTITSRCMEINLKSENEEENFDLETFKEKTTSEKLDELEKANLTAYLKAWHATLKQKVLQGEADNNLKRLWSYTKLVAKLKKAQGQSINKKLIALILTLELPAKGY